MKLCILFVATLLLGVACFIDFKWKILPDSTTVAIGVLGILFALLEASIFPVLLRALIVFASSVLLVLPGWMGFGDAKLFPALSLFFPDWSALLSFILLTFLANGIFCLGGLLLKRFHKNSEVPMGLAIFVSFVFCQLSLTTAL